MKNGDKQESLNQAASEEALRPGRGESYVDWAIELLCQGETNENIAILAGLRQPLYLPEVMNYLRLAAQELGLDLTVLTAPEALWQGIQSIASQIVAGKVTPYDGCQNLYRLYYDLEFGRLEYYRYFSAYLFNFVYLDEDYGFQSHGESYRLMAENDSREEIDRCVIEEASILLTSPVPQKP